MTTFRNHVIRGNALFLILASAGGLVTDIAGSFFGHGAEATLLAGSPGAGIGFIEAHGLALIIGIAAWGSAYARQWHLGLASVHALLASVNLLFWQYFVAIGLLTVGYSTTILHITLIVAHLIALAIPVHAPRHLVTDTCS
ncbi:hypothetical protein IG197_24075 [Aminobacter sp. SR38]|jgi:lysylphosphatidylglycerol synthetase-like protein (DUF2156 family)|uniref:hypothetical protein n=1 Tax=Aminobacter TaxID=31988 RepID=UPI0017830000|nr:hypothetical protein [Aminobacter sp. SR38]QOF70833.1 hypothetical protein IG197_24075 [Aminobacter sp. SR38]